MLKYLLLLGLVAALWWRWRQKKRATVEERPPSVPPVEDIVRCAHCAVYLPRSEALRTAADWYCCPAHERAGPRPQGRE